MSLFLLAGGVAAVFLAGSVFVRIIGGVAVVMAVVMPFGVHRSWVSIEGDRVMVGGRLGSVEFVRGDATASKVWTPGNLVGRRDGIMLSRSDGVETLVPLGAYKRSDRDVIAGLIRKSLNA